MTYSKAMQAKTERFEMRLDQVLIERLDGWRAGQDDVPSRAEAVRRLVESALSSQAARVPDLSDGEKLTLLLLGDIVRHLKIRSDLDPKFIESVIVGGHYWALNMTYRGVLHGYSSSPDVLKEVVDILDMWSFVESGYKKLSAKEKSRLEVEAAPFGKDVAFRGFDGNNESEHMSVATFLIDDMDRFAEFKGRYLNSHARQLDSYQRMLSVFGPMRHTLTGGQLSVQQLVEILRARIHPSRA